MNAVLPKEPGASVHVVLDNDGAHKTAAVKRWFLRHPEYHLHYTPTSASWLNPVERFFASITEQRIRRGVFTSVPAREHFPEVAIPTPRPNWVMIRPPKPESDQI